MSFKEALSYLLDNGYLVVIENQVVVTRKLTDSLNLPKTEVLVSTRPVVSTESVQVMEAVKPKTIVKKTQKDIKETWDQFVLDADVPWRVTTPKGEKYTVRQYGPTAGAKLQEIINTEGIDYEVLVKCTNFYYKNTTYKAILSNYFLKDIWQEEYNEFIKKGKGSVNMGDMGNPFED